MDEVDAGPSWARYRGQTLMTDQDQGFYDSSPIKTSTFSSEVYSVSTFGTSPNSGITSVQHHGSFSHGALSLPGAGYDDVELGLDINHQLLSTATLPNESAISDEASGCTIISSPELALLLKAGLEKYLLIDSRSFLEYNTSHIQQSANVCCSKLIKRRLQRDKVHIRDLLTQTCHIDIDEFVDIIVYDQCTEHPRLLTDDTFLCVLLQKLSATFKRVALLRGGFLAFQAMYPSLCESKSNSYRCAALTSLSQPCLPVSNVGPTRILPFLYLGSQQDALSPDIVQVNEITYVLNVSTTCIKPPHISDGHFLRIPVNDNYSAKLQPYFKEAFQFLDKVREANGCCLVHCLAGISRSPTLAIAYIMTHLNMSSDDAYRYVKDKRPTISPNFNFLGQLLEFEKDIKREREMTNNNSDGSIGQKSESRLWSNYVMDLSTHSPSSPVSKNMRPFVFDVSSLTQRPAAAIGRRTVVEGKTEQKSMENVGSGQELTFPVNANSEAERPFPRKLISSSNHIYQSSNVVKQEVTVSTQRSPFPFSKDSTLPRPNVLNLGFEPTTRRVPGTLNTCKDSSHSMSKSLTDIREASDTESPSPSMCMDSKEHVFTTSTITYASRNVKPLLSPFPCGESTIADHSLIMDQISACNAVSETSGNIHSSDKTREVQLVTSNVTDRNACDNSPSLSSRTEPNYSPQLQTPITPSANSPFSFSETFLKSRGKRPLRNSLSLSLSPITPTRPKPPTHLPVDSGDIPTEKCVPSACKIERKIRETLSETYNKPNIPAIPPSSTCTSSVTTSHVVKLKSFSFSSSSMSLPAQSPTSSLARLHFGSADTSDSENDRDMDTSHSESKLPSPEHVSINRRAFSEPIDRDKFYSFPSTSLDKLNFTPCLSNSTENIQTCCSSSRTVGVKRPLNNDILDLKESDLSSQGSLNCSMTSSSNNSSVSSPTTSGSQQKVVVRKREGRAKRTLVRPNSIAFSTYPTFDLGSDCQDSPNSASSTASQDDSCETYVQNGKKSKSSEYMTDVRFRLGRYSEREVYRQITAAMETAMLKTQAFEASRKSRSLDDILSSEDDSSAPNCESSMFDRVLRHCAMNRDRYSSPTLLLENLACSRGHNVSDTYHSNSSLSSAGSHSSLHSSLELIQVS